MASKRNTVKKIYSILLLMLAIASLASCDWKFKLTGEEDDPDRIEIQRYDRLESRYLSTGDFSALQQMNTTYPVETRTLVEDVLQLGAVTDSHINNRFLSFFQDSTLQNIISDAEAQYANMDDLNDMLSNSFIKLRELLPDVDKPVVYAQIGALDQSIIVGDKMIGVSLDKYLGKDYPVYTRFYTAQQRETMERKYIVPDCLTFYLLSLYPMKDHDQRPQLERDLHVGKVMWTVNKVLPHPAFNGRFIKMVDRYMKCHKDVTVEQLLKSNDYSQFK